ncbi:MAG: sigma 54-interacting transcriptional regulator [Desulfobulbaceae bacterium]|nr:sigma 54-interacting transcriptional regulator [Desulfobulbaceae bacterium]
MQRLLHELEVHQIELKMQNAELQQVRNNLEQSLNKYAELYDFAPVGYFACDAHGMIKRCNLAGSRLLGVERRLLTETDFSSLIADPEGRELWRHHFQRTIEDQGVHLCELTLRTKDGQILHCQLQSAMVDTCDGRSGCVFTAITDVTPDWQLREELKEAHANQESLVAERTSELSAKNVQLTQEIDLRQRIEDSLLARCAEIKALKSRLEAENVYLQHEAARNDNFGQIIGQSQVLVQVFKQIEQVAPQEATVLLLGETGTGKGVIARTIHSRSSRRERPMVTINCTALPANLIESELFGREKGAFTGANARQVGRFELADGGTIFLDEIGEMPLELQAKLLRVIQDGEFERLGSPRSIKVDVRIIAATNRNLEEEISNGRFRADLFYRLNVFPITIPPLRQRKEDIPILVNHFVAKFNKKMGKKIESVSKDTLDLLHAYHWPGNVRELESTMERAVIVSNGNTLQVLDRFCTCDQPQKPAGQEVMALTELEHDHILLVLEKTGGRIEGKTGAAVILGLNPSTLRARMRKLGIPRQ